MKTLIVLLLAACSLNAADIKNVGPDVRIVGTTRVDLAPVHQWLDRGRKGDRPMPHWKCVGIESVQSAAPWPTCYIQIDQKEHKTVYVKNLPKEIPGQLSRVSELEAKKEALAKQVEADNKILLQAEGSDAQWGSDLARRRRELREKLHTEESQLRALTKQIDEVKANTKVDILDLAMFTGQVYNKLEVWDFGMKQ